jgi:hypothetical protein
MVARYLSNHDLATAAQTSRKLRELAEHKLYSKVVIPYRRIRMYDDDKGEEKEIKLSGEYTLWPLYKTLVQRPDPAKKVRAMDI